MFTVSGDKGTLFFDITLEMTAEQWNDLSQGEKVEILSGFNLQESDLQEVVV